MRRRHTEHWRAARHRPSRRRRCRAALRGSTAEGAGHATHHATHHATGPGELLLLGYVWTIYLYVQKLNGTSLWMNTYCMYYEHNIHLCICVRMNIYIYIYTQYYIHIIIHICLYIFKSMLLYVYIVYSGMLICRGIWYKYNFILGVPCSRLLGALWRHTAWSDSIMHLELLVVTSTAGVVSLPIEIR